jgi:hypothetical protein
MKLRKLGLYLGSNNPSYGTIWIHNNEKNVRIKKDKFEEYQKLGFIKGRIGNDIQITV